MQTYCLYQLANFFISEIHIFLFNRSILFKGFVYVHNITQPQACEWPLQYAKVSLHRHQLGFPKTWRKNSGKKERNQKPNPR